MTGGNEVRAVEFASLGNLLRGRLYEHDPGRRWPAVVMTHGFSATITGMVAERYAEVLHSAGINVLLFDHAGFGTSDGEPRRVINRWRQIFGYRDALDFIAAVPGVDASRISVWGDSNSGASALGVAAFDERVAAVVVQVPACGSAPLPPDRDSAAFRALHDIYQRSALPPVRKTIGPMAVVAADQLASPSLLEPITAFRWFIDYGARPGTGWLNQATFEVPDTPIEYHPGLCTPHLRCPSFWAVANDDEMPGAEPEVARAAFAAASEPKQLLQISGGHFGLLYYPSALFDLVSQAQAEFLIRHLSP